MRLHSVIQPDLTECYITHSNNIAIHHIFGGANRNRSDKYGFIVALRPDWHNMSNKGVHFNRGLDISFKKKAQIYFENNIGSRERFISEFGRSYL